MLKDLIMISWRTVQFAAHCILIFCNILIKCVFHYIRIFRYMILFLKYLVMKNYYYTHGTLYSKSHILFSWYPACPKGKYAVNN